MKELVEVIAKALVDDPESVVVNEREEKKATVTKPSAPPVRTGYKKGDKVTLENAKLYSTAYDKTVDKAISGTYYIYDGIRINGRYRITNSKDKVGKEPVGQNVTGFVAL